MGYVADDDAWRRLVPEPRYEWMQVTIYGANVEYQGFRGGAGGRGCFHKGVKAVAGCQKLLQAQRNDVTATYYEDNETSTWNNGKLKHKTETEMAMYKRNC